jgi:hypothetical protein
MGLIDQGFAIGPAATQSASFVSSPMSRQSIAVQVGTNGRRNPFGHRPALLTACPPSMQKHDGMPSLLVSRILRPVNRSFGTGNHRPFVGFLYVVFYLRRQKRWRRLRTRLMDTAGDLLLGGLDVVDGVDEAPDRPAETSLEQDDRRHRPQSREGKQEPARCWHRHV